MRPLSRKYYGKKRILYTFRVQLICNYCQQNKQSVINKIYLIEFEFTQLNKYTY